MDALTEGYGLIEGPVWVAGRGLMFSDVLGGGVFCLGPDGTVGEVFAHRRGIGGMSLHANAGMVVSGRNISYKAFAGGDTVELLPRDEAAGLVGFNDITTDSAGRVYAGGLGASPVFADGREPEAQNLYLIDLDGSSRIVAREILLTNGLGFSPDGRTLYHSDTSRAAICCYAVSDNGDLGPKQTFATSSLHPDGLAVAEDGSVWVAMAGGSGVVVYNADGSERQHIEIPHPMCTSLCFGGDDLRDLYIVSGSNGLEGDRRGGVFKVRTEVAGLAVPPARIPLASAG
ncbi:MAG: SMP-30/gluconolactonase/LRE family protein [Pseudomonadota bacterium]